MSCHGCATKFGVFNKEKGCPNCGFTFCKKCLRFKVIVTKLGMTEHHVCRACYDAITNPHKEEPKEQQTVPAVFLKSSHKERCLTVKLANIPSFPTFPAVSQSHNTIGLHGNGMRASDAVSELLWCVRSCCRRLESLENPAQPPITVYRHDTRMEQLKTGLAPEDREIVERLEKLKEERKQQREAPTEEDIVRRLAALKGEDLGHAVQATKKKETFHLPDTRSDKEKTDDLIKQLLQEQILAAKHISPEELIAQRLARLRGEEPRPAQAESEDIDLQALVAGPSEEPVTPPADNVRELEKLAKLELDATKKGVVDSSKRPGSKDEEMEVDSPDEAAVEKVVQKALEEAALGDDEELESNGSPGGQDVEELPWCTICNEDASHRCPDCDGDLFCAKCFQEYHQDPDLCHHRHVPFSRTLVVRGEM